MADLCYSCHSVCFRLFSMHAVHYQLLCASVCRYAVDQQSFKRWHTLVCRWCATDAMPHLSWRLHQTRWPQAVSRADQAASRYRRTVLSATRTGLLPCSPAWCTLTATCWPASGPRGVPPWTCYPASWPPSAATAPLLPVSGSGTSTESLMAGRKLGQP